ncbi:hypothetical protein GGR27_000397 [Lewinella antarctica]|uniref:Uncharacterized protein n=1 Tax=Neolewinella antarctica TaxID=442734 RepID=A0ABX0X6R5_9BACT|nr:hypothetical protein [Neolewinella antarctica]
MPVKDAGDKTRQVIGGSHASVKFAFAPWPCRITILDCPVRTGYKF